MEQSNDSAFCWILLALWVRPPTPKLLLCLNEEKCYQQLHVFLLPVISQDQKAQASLECPLDPVFLIHNFILSSWLKFNGGLDVDIKVDY